MTRIEENAAGRQPAGYMPGSAHLLSFATARRDFLTGEDNPRDFLERCLDVVEAKEPVLRGFAAIDTERARQSADASAARYRNGQPLSPVDGLPFGVKDVIETADLPMQQHNPLFRGWPTGRDAAGVYALRAGGAIVVGKTAIPEGGIGALGATRNPHDPDRTPGASSSGSAVTVGAGMLPAALATQAVGSLIRPASFCGCFGFKPTFGALNRGGVHSMNPSQACLGVIAGGLDDIWAIARQISETVGGDPGYPGLRTSERLPQPRQPRRLVRFTASGWSKTTDGTQQAFADFLDRLARLGVEIVEPDFHPDLATLKALTGDAIDMTRDIVCYEMRWPLREYLKNTAPESIGGRTLGYLKRGEEMTARDYERALSHRARLHVSLAATATLVDGIVTPSTTGPAPLAPELGDFTYNALSTILGGPCFTLPLLVVDRLPVGFQLMGFAGEDEALADIASWIVAAHSL